MAIAPVDSQSVGTATSAACVTGLIVPPRAPFAWPHSRSPPCPLTDHRHSLLLSLKNNNKLISFIYPQSVFIAKPSSPLCRPSSLHLALKPHSSPTVPPVSPLLPSPVAVSPINISVLASELLHHPFPTFPKYLLSGFE